MKIKKLLTVILAVIMIFSLVSCTGDSSEVVISAEDTSSANITANMYNYWVSTGKANFMYTYKDIKDTDEFWSSEYSDGVTHAQFLDELLLMDIKTTAVCMMLYNEYRLSLSDDVKENIKTEINEYLTEYADGNKNTLNMVLSKYGANMTILENIKQQEAKRSLVMEYLFGEGGEMALEDKDREAYYKDNYHHFQLVYINNKYEYVLDSNGKYTTNADGSYVTRALSGEKLDAKNALIESARTELDGGADFDSVYDKYSEEKPYSNGYYISLDNTYGNSTQLFNSIIGDMANAADGDVKVFEYDSGTYFVKKLPLEDKAWENKDNADFFGSFDVLATNAAFRKFCEGYFDKLTVNDKIISNYSVSNVEANSSF